MTTEAFINKYRFYVMWTSDNGVFPSVKMAQAILESASGSSLLSAKYNNFFGIKSSAGWRGNVTDLSTIEYYNGKTATTVKDGFRSYASAFDCFRDHTRFLSENGRYADALKATEPGTQIQLIHAANYATDPYYTNKVINIINKYDLQQLDLKKKEMKTAQITQSVLLLLLAVISVYITIKSL